MIRFQRRILFIVQSTQPADISRSWRNVTELAQAGYGISVIAPKEFIAYKLKPSEALIKTITLLPYGFNLSSEAGTYFSVNIRLLVWQFMLAWRVFFTRGFDVTHLCSGPDTVFLIGSFFRFFFHKKMLVDYAVCVPDLHASQSKGRSLRRVSAWLETKLLRSADIIIAANDSLRRIALASTGHRAEKVFTVRPVPLGPDKASAGSPVSRKSTKCLVAGRLNICEPAQSSLLEIIRLIHHDKGRSDVEFALAGDEAVLRVLRRQAAILGVSDGIKFVSENATAVFQKATIFIYPCDADAWSDKVTPGLLLEALALGKASVQYESAEGHFTSGESSLYTQHGRPTLFAEYILQLVDDPDLRVQLGEAARARFEEFFTWQAQAPVLLAAYDRLFHGLESLPILSPMNPE